LMAMNISNLRLSSIPRSTGVSAVALFVTTLSGLVGLILVISTNGFLHSTWTHQNSWLHSMLAIRINPGRNGNIFEFTAPSHLRPSHWFTAYGSTCKRELEFSLRSLYGLSGCLTVPSLSGHFRLIGDSTWFMIKKWLFTFFRKLFDKLR
jgi:hypothetical protein